MITNSFTNPALSRRQFLAGTAVASIGLAGLGARTPSSVPVFAQRGYYVLPCRAPTLGYEACRDMLDCMADDQANTVILWIGGGFRSKRFPVTWQYNADHANVRHDFLGRLIRHAHHRGVKCLLGFTPFGYDGVSGFRWKRWEFTPMPGGNLNQPAETTAIGCREREPGRMDLRGRNDSYGRQGRCVKEDAACG